MNENHEQPRVVEIKISATDFFRVAGPKDWHKMVDARGSTAVNYSQGLILI